jgi:predicted DNA-binding protein with PD1-like motif
MTATGEIIDGKPHIHAVLAIQGDRVVAGHLIQAHFGTSFAHAYLIPSSSNEGVVLKYFAATARRVGAESSTSESRPSTSTSEPMP